MSNTVAENQMSENQNLSAVGDSKQDSNHVETDSERQKKSAFQPPSVEKVTDQLKSLDVKSNVTMRCDAPPFTPASKVTSNENEIRVKTDYIFDLKKYKHDYFISELSCSSDRDSAKFGAPTGICTLPNDRILVANFDRDSLLLLDINGVVHEIYKDLPTPKDVIYTSSASGPHALVATRKEAILLDLNKKTVVTRSKLRGFYPWNIQYIEERNTYLGLFLYNSNYPVALNGKYFYSISACDPSGERVVFLDQNLVELSSWSFHDATQDHLLQSQPQLYQKVYPYAAYFLADDSVFALTHRQDKCHLQEYDYVNSTVKSVYTVPPSLQSYSIYVDSTKKCLIADKLNHRLVSIDKDSNITEYRSKSLHEPYSMTFLSNGTLCVTDWNKSYGTNGGIAVISEVNLKQK